MNAQHQHSQILRFFSNPIVGILGSLASILGLFLAIVFYRISLLTPELVYSLNPVSSVVVPANRPTDLSISFRGEPVTGVDVVTLQVAVWNQGRGTIRPSGVLRTIEICLSPSGRILDAFVTKQNRDVVGFRIPPTSQQFAKGCVPLLWDILERGDGANIQITYAGDSEAQVRLSGIIEGQGEPHHLIPFVLGTSARSSRMNVAEQYAQMQRDRWFFPAALASPTILLLAGALISKGRSVRSLLELFGRRFLSIFLFATVVSLIAAVYLFFRMQEGLPPFGWWP